MEFLKDDFVRLPAEAGGALGRVMEDSGGGKVRVRFPDGERVFRLEFCAMTKVEKDDETAALTLGLAVKPRKPTTAALTSKTLAELIQVFRREYPEGFEDQHYVNDERGPKLTAHKQMLAQLNAADMRAMIDANRFPEVTQHIQTVIEATDLLSHFEAVALEKALKEDAAQQVFSKALYALLYGEGEAAPRFESFVAVLKSLDAAKWPIATYFTFMAEPSKNLVLKPEASKSVATLCGVNLHYAVLPNWRTYSQLLLLGQQLLKSLTEAGLAPRDMMDVQAFLGAATRLDKKHGSAA